MFFEYGEKEISYLKDRDRRLGDAIDKIGHINRAVDSDLFSSVVHHIIGQQISTTAQATLWKRLNERLRLFVKRNFSRDGKNQAGKAPWTVKSRFRGWVV